MEHAPLDYVPTEDRYMDGRRETQSRQVGCMIGAALCGLSAMIMVALFAWLFMTLTARAHDAIPTASQPLGWSYGWDCCSLQDCAAVDPGGISETPAGYVVKRTGEVIGYSDKRLRRSKDELYHRCAKKGNFDDPKSLCLYVPDRGF